MKKTKSVNNLILNSSISEKGQKFKNIMNSPNFGKQQIILQSCCFFDYEKSQTPHTSHSSISFSNNNNTNKLNSSRISEKNRPIFSKNKSNMDLIKSKFYEMRKNEIQKLKNENKVLKDTINNLISQLDKTFHIAENVKNKEKNISENMKNKINNLIIEKQQLLKQIQKQENNFSNNRRNSWTNIRMNKFGHKNIISEINNDLNKSLEKSVLLTESIESKNELKYNTNYFDMINHLKKENNKLKNQLNLDNINRVSIDLYNDKEINTSSIKNYDMNRTNNDNYSTENNVNKITYDKRLNKRKFIFNKKKAEKAKIEYPLTQSHQNLENDNLIEKYENLLKEKKELKICFNDLLNDIDKSKIYNTEKKIYQNENSYINNPNYIQMKKENSEQKLKILNLEKVNTELNNKYNKLNSDLKNK